MSSVRFVVLAVMWNTVIAHTLLCNNQFIAVTVYRTPLRKKLFMPCSLTMSMSMRTLQEKGLF